MPRRLPSYVDDIRELDEQDREYYTYNPQTGKHDLQVDIPKVIIKRNRSEMSNIEKARVISEIGQAAFLDLPA